MSGVVKTVKKVFKKVVKVVKKIVKPILIGVGIYFTAGLALSAMPATAGFAASMPGFAGGGVLGTGIGAGSTAGTGIFTKAASAIGLGGGLQAGAAAKTAAAGTGAFAGMTSGPITSAAGATAGAALPAAAAKAGMSLTDKLLFAKLGTDVAGALFGPTPEEEYRAQAIENAKFRGAFYGMDESGSTYSAPAPAAAAQPQQTQPQQQPLGAPQSTAAPQRPMGEAPSYSNSITPEQQQLLDGRERRELFPRQRSQPQPGMTTGPGQMQAQLPVPEGLFAPGENVRYV